MLSLLPVEPFLRRVCRCAGRCKLLQPVLCGRIHSERDPPGLDRTNAGDPRSPMPDRHRDRGPSVRLVVVPCLRRTNRVCAGLTVAIMATAAFLTQEHRCKHPMLPLRFFCDRRFLGATLVGFLINMTLYGALFVLGLYFQVTRHWPAWVSGIAFLPLPAVLGNRQHPGQPNRGPAGAQRLHVQRFAHRRERCAVLIALAPKRPMARCSSAWC